jgi:ribosome-associated heat shock protein Hsp15
VTDPKQFEILEMARIGGFVKRQKGLGRPTKKEGREIARFTEEAFFGFDDDDEPLDDDNDV